MLEWETPPDFTSGILSATKLRILCKDTDYLQGWADGPHSVFCGVKREPMVNSVNWETAWEGHIRHQKNTLRYVIWSKSNDPDTNCRITYGGTALSNIYLGLDAAWTEHSGRIDLSSYGFTVGTWYALKVEVRLQGGKSGSGFHLAMLREQEAISGWQTVADFSASEAALATKLNRLSNNLTKLKDAADSPGTVLTGIDYGATGGLQDIEYADDSDYSYSVFGGGCQHPGTAAKLYCVWYIVAEVQVQVFYKAGNGAWNTAAAPSGDKIFDDTYTTSGVKEEFITLPTSISSGEFCRVRIRAKENTSDTYLRLWECGVVADETLAKLAYWRFGRGLDWRSLNTLRNRIRNLHPARLPGGRGKLSCYTNQAIKRLTTTGYRVHIRRRRGYRYLHYKPYADADSEDTPMIEFRSPEGTWGYHHNLSRGDGTGAWDSEDIEKLARLYHGMYYCVNDVAAAQEWTDVLE